MVGLARRRGVDVGCPLAADLAVGSDNLAGCVADTDDCDSAGTFHVAALDKEAFAVGGGRHRSCDCVEAAAARVVSVGMALDDPAHPGCGMDLVPVLSLASVPLHPMLSFLPGAFDSIVQCAEPNPAHMN